jgi:hypothetical protein
MRREAGPPGVPWLGGILVFAMLQPFVWHALRFGLLSLWALQPPASFAHRTLNALSLGSQIPFYTAGPISVPAA